MSWRFKMLDCLLRWEATIAFQKINTSGVWDNMIPMHSFLNRCGEGKGTLNSVTTKAARPHEGRFPFVVEWARGTAEVATMP